MRRLLLLPALAAVVAGLALPASSSPLEPPRDRWHASNEAQDGRGHWSPPADRVRVDEACLDLPAAEQEVCALAALQAEEHVVVAFVDSGINPYTQDFRAPEHDVHPSAFISGFPADAPALDLSLDVADAQGYAAAREADAEMWEGVERDRLHWIPGTRIIGAYSSGAGGTGLGSYRDLPVLDDNGHGTGVVSVAAGRWHGSNPDALIVMVEGLGHDSVRWATEQPWIDVVSNSWGPGLPGRADIPTDMGFTRDAVDRGQSILFSSGNGAYNTNSSTVFTDGLPDPCRCKVPPPNASTTARGSGPSWHVTVGAASPVNGQAHWWGGRAPDVVSFGSKWRAAAADGVALAQGRDFGGTSCATPITAGVLSSLVLEARRSLGDTVEGPRGDGVVATGPQGAGLLSDGVLTNDEAEAALLTTAQPVAADPERLPWDYAVEPTSDAYWLAQGYGLVDRASRDRALAVLRGEAALPVRADVEAWRSVSEPARDLAWG